ncbi:MAG: hypothetical protein DCC75_10675 [Proteobacteria bacterium]|nr:MAG: hypothetical protein DCC75_10675 [Pseudomonadota bacterium]
MFWFKHRKESRMRRMSAGILRARIAVFVIGSVTLMMTNCNPLTGLTVVIDGDGEAVVNTTIGLPAPVVNLELPPLPEP